MTTLLHSQILDTPATSLMVGNYISLVSEGAVDGSSQAEFAATELFAKELSELNSLVTPEGPYSVYPLESAVVISRFTLAATILTLQHPASEAVAKIAELAAETRAQMQGTIDAARSGIAA